MAIDWTTIDDYTRMTLQSLKAGIDAHNSQMIVGNPGLGKSALVKMLAEDVLGYSMITIIGSQKEPQDVTGFPRLVEKPLPDGTPIPITEYAIPIWEFEILRKKKILLFLDEFSNSTPAVQAAMLQILNEREFPDGSKLPTETVIIGAMNPVETAADGYELGLPVTNRLKFLPWEPNYHTWSQGLLTNWGHPEKVSKAEMWWRKKVTDFLDRHNDLLYKLPNKGYVKNPGSVYEFGDSPAQNDIYKMAYPTNRSWTHLAAELAALSTGNKSVSYELMGMSAKGIVGYEAAKEFSKFVRMGQSNMPSTEDAVSEPSSVQWAMLNGNERMQLFKNVVDWANAQHTEQAATLLGRFMLSAAEAGQTQAGTFIVTDAMRVLAHSSDPTLAKRVRQAYNLVGQMLRQ